MMALSTFFIGLSMKPETKADKWLRVLMMVHGIFFISCVFMPMTGMFAHMGDGDHYNAAPIGGGALALIIWCIYFLPIGYIMTAAGLCHESSEDRRVAANIGLITAAVYAVLIMLVYYSQLTTVHLEKLDGAAKNLLDYRRGSLMFNNDLLG